MIDYTVFEILIYRITEKKFYTQYEKRKKTVLDKASLILSNQIHKDILQRLEIHFFENYGGPWNYNQIIGAVEIFLFGNQIRGNLWLSNKKRFGAKMSNKNISNMGKVFEISVFHDTENIEISSEIKREIIEHLKYDKRLIPDFRAFNTIVKYVDWKQLLFDYKENIFDK